MRLSPKEKAKELVDKYIPLTVRLVADYDWVEDIDSAKQCALILVEEMIEEIRSKYWYDVKREIELL